MQYCGWQYGCANMLTCFEALVAAGVEGNVYRICEGMGHGAYTHPQYYTEMMDWFVTQAFSK